MDASTPPDPERLAAASRFRGDVAAVLTVVVTTIVTLGFCAWVYVAGSFVAGYLTYLLVLVPLFFGAWICKAVMTTRGPAGPHLGVMGPVVASFTGAILLSGGHPAADDAHLLAVLTGVAAGAVAALAIPGWWWRLGALAVLAGLVTFVAAQ
ncbi:hypothetical protein GCM10023216_20860 [Isoptericola chiayiensis]|uniref:Uncharacterized protein n=1 Tax=Isoptericola chiayiensis TaxID=579446 RepID=A0ABP8YG92_9MICO|nr:hypothetical protein [Isoptericola chiayiensis]NOW00314.1 hypothetical protein [Isoptericola chiayiensis]